MGYPRTGQSGSERIEKEREAKSWKLAFDPFNIATAALGKAVREGSRSTPLLPSDGFGTATVLDVFSPVREDYAELVNRYIPPIENEK